MDKFLINHRIKGTLSSEGATVVIDAHPVTGLAFIEIIKGPDDSVMAEIRLTDFDKMVDAYIQSKEEE